MATTLEHSVPRSRKGRGKAAKTIAIGEAADRVLDKSRWPMTLRQTYYALVSSGVIPKTENAYRQLGTIVKDLREDGKIPWEWVVDNNRVVNAARTWNGLQGLLDDAALMYRRDLMRNQDVAIQVWAESDSIGSVIANVARRYAIPTYIGRGYSSRGYLWEAAKDIVEASDAGKQTVVLHVGDYDPSGEDIFRDVEESLGIYATAQDYGCSVASIRDDIKNGIVGMPEYLTVRRIALTPDQIERHRLPTRPPKAKDRRLASFSGTGTVEVEALPVDVLLGIVEDAILDYIDEDALEVARIAEKSEREIAARIARTPVEKLLKAAS